jgi:SAM-dependent methyltransferase
VRLDERIVEYPWVFAQDLRGRVLDAGSALNHPFVLDRVLPRVDSLDIFTQAPEAFASANPKVTYRYGDLRDLDVVDDSYDTICCISTVEHVGMDNAHYGVGEPRSMDPPAELRRAVAELLRVLRPGGQLLITTPYGAPIDKGWFRQLARDEVEELAGPAGEVTVFRYTPSGWTRSDLADAADARYRDVTADGLTRRDGAVAARAVACIRLTV